MNDRNAAVKTKPADKKRFLVVYEYGMGGSWMFIYARSADEIRARYPMLNVVETMPGWITQDSVREIETNATYDIDARPAGFLLALLKERGYDKPSGSR